MASNRIQLKPSAADIDYPETSIDQVKGSQYVWAGGTANALTVTTGGDFKLTQGNPVRFIAQYSNTGNVTVNVDGKGVYPLKMLVNGVANELPANKLGVYKSFEAFWDSTNTCFFLVARGGGDALASQLLAGKKATTDAGDIVGTMVDRTTGTYYPTANTAGSGYLSVPIPANAYYGTAAVLAPMDANYVASNIKKDTSIFNLVGTLESKLDVDTYMLNFPASGYHPSSFVEGEGLWANTVNIDNTNAYLFNSAGTLINTINCTASTYARMASVSNSHIYWSTNGNTFTYITNKAGTLLYTLNGPSPYVYGCAISSAQSKLYMYNGSNGYIVLYNLTGTRIGSNTLMMGNAFWIDILITSQGAFFAGAISGSFNVQYMSSAGVTTNLVNKNAINLRFLANALK